MAEELQSLQVDLITFSKACTYVADNIITIPSIYKVSFLFKKKSVYAILKLLSLHLEKKWCSAIPSYLSQADEGGK